jgi:DNA-binding CsgD family transcriptional regulator
MDYRGPMTGAQAYLVGRQRELDELERALATAREGSPLLAVVEGSAGLGKTALVERLLARHDDLDVRWASAVSWEQSAPFGVAGQLLRTGPSACPETDDPLETGLRLLRDWQSGQRPLVVVVDDAHWSDLPSLRALSSAHRRATTEPVLVLLITSDERHDLDVHEFLARHRGPTVRLDPLTAADVRALATRSAGLDLSHSAAQRLTEHTGGNPRHITELLREVPSETWFEWHPVLPAPRSVATGAVARLHSCSPAARALVEAAAVLGGPLSFAAAAELAGLTDPVSALDEATRAGLLTATNGRGLSTVDFPAPMVEAAVYADLAPRRRQDLHRAAASTVEDERTRLSHQVALTPFPDAGLAEELEDFATRNAAAGAWSAVGEALVDASRLSSERTQRERRLVLAVDALTGAGDLPRAMAFSPAVENFPPSPLRDVVLGYLSILLGRPAEAELLLGRAWQQCDIDREPNTAAQICQRRVLHSLARWDGAELVAWARRATELAAADEPAAVESQAIMGLGLAADGRADEAEQAYEQVLTTVCPGAQSQRVQMGKGWLDLAQDEHMTARRELLGAVPTEYRMGSTRISLWAQAWLARAEFALGAWDNAVRVVHRAAAQLERSGLDLERPLVHWTGAQIQALRGNWDAAHEHLQKGSASPHDYEVMLLPSAMARAHFAEAQADYDTVLRALEPLVHLRADIDEPGFWPWHDVYANALVVTNRVAEADEFLRPNEERAAARRHRSTSARLGYVRGRIAGASGDIDAAKEHFERALHQLHGMPLPYERARVNFAYGQTLRRAGKRREADLVLHNARDAFAALGARSYTERCDRELKAGGLHARRAEVTELTGQERAVAGLVAEGMSNKQVAVELYVSVKTVQFHLTRVYAKLGISSRGELAARFRDGSS